MSSFIQTLLALCLMKSYGFQSTAVNRINKDCHKIDIFYWLKTSFIDFDFIFMSDTFHGMMDNVTVTVHRVNNRKTPRGKQGLFAWLICWMPLQNRLQVVIVFTL